MAKTGKVYQVKDVTGQENVTGKVYQVKNVGGGGGGGDYDAEIEALNNAVSVLSTSVDLSAEIGGTTTVVLSELTAMDIDGRPSYKQAGATVYAENGVVGIIDTVDSTNAIITTVSTSASVEKGHTWTRLESSGEDSAPANLILNFGNLSDGWYEVLVKQKRADLNYESAWRLLVAVENGELAINRKKVYVPAPELAPFSTYTGWTTRDYSGYPIFIAKIDDGDFAFSGYAGYSNLTPGSIGQDYQKVIYDVSDLLNLDTGEYMDLKNAKIVESYGWEPEFTGHQSYSGASPYATEITIPNFQTGGSGPSHSEPFYGIEISQGFAFGNKDLADYLSFGHAPKSMIYLYVAFSDMSSSTILKIQLFMGELSVEPIKATGVFANTIWDCRVRDNTNVLLYPNNVITVPDGLLLNSGFCYFGNSGSYCDINFYGYDNRSDYTPNFQMTVLPRQVPTASSSAYTLYHENGLIEMGGIVSITDTLQPDVALGNVPVVFSQELANANFVPTITVMTDGTFKQVMADVANPATTGFDLCVRNVDTEAVSGIKIAWKVVGTKK